MPLSVPSAFLQPPPIQPIDVYGSILRGQTAPLELQQAQQQTAMGGLQLDQLRQMMGFRQAVFGRAQQEMAGGAANPDNQQNYPSTSGVGGSSAGGINPAPPTTSTQSGSAPSDGGLAGNSDLNPLGMSPQTQQAMALLGMGKEVGEAREVALKTAQLQAQGSLSLADSVISSPNPGPIVNSSQTLRQGWLAYARRLGIQNPQDPLSMTPQNLRAAATLYYNDVAGRVGLPPKAMPDQMVEGQYGSQYSAVTGKRETAPTMPTYSLEKTGYDPRTGRETGQMVQTSPGGPSAPGTQGVSGRGGGIGSTVGPQVDLGLKAPTDPELKAAMFGSEMRPALQTLTRMENAGFNLSPKARALAINMATSEDAGAMSQLLSQEVARHGLTPDEQTYMSAMMPMLQAAGHDQSGARLTTGQIRQNVESIIPMDANNKSNLEQVNKNRQGFYYGLLTQAGPATQLPQYRNTLYADLQEAQRAASGAPTMPSLADIQAELARRRKR